MLVWNFGHTPNFSLFIPSAKNIFDWGTKIKICLMNVVVHICTLKDNLQYFPFNSFKQWWYHSILYRYMKRVRVRSHIHKFFSPEDLSTAHEGNIRENEQLLSLSPSTAVYRFVSSASSGLGHLVSRVCSHQKALTGMYSGIRLSLHLCPPRLSSLFCKITAHAGSH